MLIVESSPNIASNPPDTSIVQNSTPAIKKTRSLNKPLLIASLGVTLGLLTIPVAIALIHNQSPTGTLLNPQPQNQLASTSPAPTPVNPSQSILAAQAYLEKAIELSQKQPQTPADREAILTHLDQALNLANQAVVAAPSNPQSYLIRARILASSTSIRPDAQSLAQQDLQIAQNLSRGQTVNLPTQVDLLQTSPTRQAALADNVIIASPEDGNTATASGESQSNLSKQTFIFPAGQTTFKLTDTHITPDSYIYLIPQGTNSSTFFVQTKDNGAATIATSDPLETSTTVEYWISQP